jgi:hypothetical protein
MSRRQVVVLLSELDTVRVACPTCKGVMEMGIGQAASDFRHPRCPICAADWLGVNAQEDNDLARFVRALQRMASEHRARVQVAFVLAEEDEPRVVE